MTAEEIRSLVEQLKGIVAILQTADPEDRRSVVVALTAKGEAFFRDFESVIRRRWEEALLALGPDELAAFHDVLTKLRQHLAQR